MRAPDAAAEPATSLTAPDGAPGTVGRVFLSARERWQSRVLVCDGAMGTMLHAAGVPLDRSLPELNVTRPDLVSSIHQAYVGAGAEIVETNTYGASRFRLARHGLEERVAELNGAGVRLARAVRDQMGRSVLVAGSVSAATPPGFRGRLSAADVRTAFHEQVSALLEAGIDLLIFETFGSLSEMEQAINVTRAIDASVPLVALMTFVDDGRTIAGDSPREVAVQLEQCGVDVLGANCTLGPQGILDVMRELARYSRLPLAAQPNAGPPSVTEGHFHYTADVAYVARHARAFADLGAVLVGGCCGTTPAHTDAIAAAVQDLAPSRQAPPPRASIAVAAERPRTESPVSHSTLQHKLAAHTFVMACELAPAVGGEVDRAVQDAADLRDAGCDVVVVAPAISARAHVSPVSLALLLQQRAGVETILTATTWEKSVMALEADLLGAYAFGIRHVLCRTGTPPLQGDYPNVAGIWDVDSLGLIQILNGLNEGRDHNGISLARPTSFVVGARINPSADSLATEVAMARRKLDAGATFLVTPPVYDLESMERLIDAVRPPSNVSLLVGVQPLRDYRHAEYLQHEVPEMQVPEGVLRRMQAAGERGPEVGLAIALEIIRAARSSGYADGVVVSSARGQAAEMGQVLGLIDGSGSPRG